MTAPDELESDTLTRPDLGLPADPRQLSGSLCAWRVPVGGFLPSHDINLAGGLDSDHNAVTQPQHGFQEII